MAAAQPRDLVLDERGLAYLRRADGSLAPYGHGTPAEPAPLRAVPTAKPGGGGGGTGGGGDSTPPQITELDPADSSTIGSSHTFGATVVDPESGVRSVTFRIRKGDAPEQSFAASPVGGDLWTVGLTGFTDGEWSWYVVAKNNGKRGGLTATSPTVSFTVQTGTGGGGGGGTEDVVTNAEWTAEGDVQTAAGRIYFEMPTNGPNWGGYVCSGTVVTDGVSGRSVILTAAHCVYDDVNKVFARNVLFIPDQDGTTGTGTDRNCGNDPLGCWAPRFGVVDADWATRTFPANIPWDYGYYVVDDSVGFTQGIAEASSVLDVAAGSLAIGSTSPTVGDRTHALGYSYSDDPNLMYCAEGLGTESSYGDWWLPSCDLSGGSSGGPWVQPMDEGTGRGPVISVNSWGYTNQPGMAGPKLVDTSASCLFSEAKVADLSTQGGVVPGDC